MIGRDVGIHADRILLEQADLRDRSLDEFARDAACHAFRRAGRLPCAFNRAAKLAPFRDTLRLPNILGQADDDLVFCTRL